MSKIDEITNELQILSINNDKIILLQRNIRRFLVRNYNKKQEDNYKLKYIKKFNENFKEDFIFIDKINQKLNGKIIRKNNFPSHISENIVKIVFYEKYKIMLNWNTPSGDLILDKYKLNKKIEVKGFITNAPISFGANENWNILYIVDCKDFINDKFIIYEIFISNNDEKWKKIKVNKTQTFEDQAKNNRRPRLTFNLLITQINNSDYNIIKYKL